MKAKEPINKFIQKVKDKIPDVVLTDVFYGTTRESKYIIDDENEFDLCDGAKRTPVEKVVWVKKNTNNEEMIYAGYKDINGKKHGFMLNESTMSYFDEYIRWVMESSMNKDFWRTKMKDMEGNPIGVGDEVFCVDSGTYDRVKDVVWTGGTDREPELMAVLSGHIAMVESNIIKKKAEWPRN